MKFAQVYAFLLFEVWHDERGILNLIGAGQTFLKVTGCALISDIHIGGDFL
jgi:hypothetical protein